MSCSESVTIELEQLGQLHKTSRHILFLGQSTFQATGSCVWNGGTSLVRGWLNLKVSGDTLIDGSPANTLQDYAQQLTITHPLAGMMTAASMNSLRYAVQGDHQTRVACLVTAGIENARRCGDRADELPQPGTINIALICNRIFSPAACIEALMMVTEAKTAACYDLNIKSPVSNQTATGTGTDSICVLSAIETDKTNVIEYCGKHTALGEWIGTTAYTATLDSLQACLKLRH